MSVRTGDRAEGKLTVIEASKNLLRYTHDRVKDQKIFPKADRWLMAKDVWECASHTYTSIIRANAIRVENVTDAEMRLALIKEAIGYLDAFMALVDTCNVLGKISDERTEYWAGLGVKVMIPLKGWLKSERRRYKSFTT